MIFITGSGRSGTTFLASLFHNLEFELLPECQEEFSHPELHHGLEGRATELSRRILELRGIRMPDHEVSKPSTLRALEEPLPADLVRDVQALDAEVLKSPHAAVVLSDWLALRRDIEFVVLCVRDEATVIDRWKEVTELPEDRLLQDFFVLWGRVFWAMLGAGVPFAAAEFPRMAQDPEYLWEVLEPGIAHRVSRERFIEVHQKVANSEWIHS